MSLPDSPSGRHAYLELRDLRNRYREAELNACKGDLQAFHALLLASLADEAELPALREIADFLDLEGILDPSLKEAYEAIVAWAKVLRERIPVHSEAVA